MWHIFKTAHHKVEEFRKGRSRQSDEQFVSECLLPSVPEARRIAIGVRRAVANIGLIDPLFIRASDRFPEELEILPLWDSMDWVALILELESELGQPIPQSWRCQLQFTVRQLVESVYQELAGHGRTGEAAV